MSEPKDFCYPCTNGQYPEDLEEENAKLRDEIERLRDCLCHERTRVAELIDRAEAAEAKLKAAIPDGWQVVPKKPTKRMLNNWPDSYSPHNVYKAFLEAAPTLREKE